MAFGMPVAYDLAAVEDDGVENAIVGVGVVAVGVVERVVAAFVADQVFVKRRQQDDLAAATAGAAVGVQIIGLATVAFSEEFAADAVDGSAALADRKPSPPDEVVEGCRGMAAEILAGQHGQRLVTGGCRRWRDPFLQQGISVLGGMICAATYYPIILSETQFARKKKDNRDKGQREFCGCMVSKDIGEYNTCPHLCEYCYANASKEKAQENYKKHEMNPLGETIIGN